MKKIKDLLFGMNFALLVFLSLAIKSLIYQSSYPEAIIFACACGIYGYKLYLKSKIPDPVRVNEEVRKEIDNMKGALTALKLEKNISKPQKYF